MIILVPVSDASTCSLTPSSPSQRWWQVQVRTSLVSRVLVLPRSLASVASLSVFVIELLPGTKAEYKRCEMVTARSEEYTEYECHGERAEFVYIRCGACVFVWLIKHTLSCFTEMTEWWRQNTWDYARSLSPLHQVRHRNNSLHRQKYLQVCLHILSIPCPVQPCIL